MSNQSSITSIYEGFPIAQHWVSASIYHHDLNSLFVEPVVPFLLQLEEVDFHFSRAENRGKHLLVVFHCDESLFKAQVKAGFEEAVNAFFKENPSPERKFDLPVNDWFLPFPYDYIHYNESFQTDLMETGGLQATAMADYLLAQSSRILAGFIASQGKDWSAEEGIGMGMQIHIMLLASFGLDAGEMASFFDYAFENIFKKTQVGGDDPAQAKAQLKAGLEENFMAQQEGLMGYMDYLVAEATDEPEWESNWENYWQSVVDTTSAKMNSLADHLLYILPEGFTPDESRGVSPRQQRFWPVLEYYIRAINTQMGLEGVLELNLMYCLKAGLNLVAKEQ